MDWYAVISLVFGDLAPIIIAVLAYLFALGVYKLIKDWLPF
nr:MAG TPA: hypothetical protein [Inoviridae sp.]